MAFIILLPHPQKYFLFLFQVLMWWTGFIIMWRASRIGEKRGNMPATSLKLDTSATLSTKSLSLSNATIFLEIFVAVCIILQLLYLCVPPPFLLQCYLVVIVYHTPKLEYNYFFLNPQTWQISLLMTMMGLVEHLIRTHLLPYRTLELLRGQWHFSISIHCLIPTAHIQFSQILDTAMVVEVLAANTVKVSINKDRLSKANDMCFFKSTNYSSSVMGIKSLKQYVKKKYIWYISTNRAQHVPPPPFFIFFNFT